MDSQQTPQGMPQRNPNQQPQTPRPHSARASRDTRIAARTLRDQHYTYAQIAS
jgi:hypothetical protein